MVWSNSFTNSFMKTACSCHVTYALWSESTLYSCLNVKDLLARSRREIRSLNDCNWTQTQNDLVRKPTVNHLAKWLSVHLRTKWFWVRVHLQSFKSFMKAYAKVCKCVCISCYSSNVSMVFFKQLNHLTLKLRPIIT